MSELPILWSFRRCPYAMRSRLAIMASGVQVQLREVLLREKPAPFLQASPKGTVPVLQTASDVIEESLDIMIWALRRSDPLRWLEMDEDGFVQIALCDGPFKSALDRTKYAIRFENVDVQDEKQKAISYLATWDEKLARHQYLVGPDCTLADMAILPFVRQFANIDRQWFDNQGLKSVARWLDGFLGSDDFADIMSKYPVWQPGQEPIVFGG